MSKIFCTYISTMTSDNRLVQLMVFDDPVHKRAAMVAKVGLGKSPVKLIQPEEYPKYRIECHQKQMKFLEKNIQRPGKKVKLNRAETHKNDVYPINCIEALQTRAKMFSTKAVNALNYVIGTTPGKTLAHAQRQIEEAEKAEKYEVRNKYYSAADGSGIFQ